MPEVVDQILLAAPIGGLIGNGRRLITKRSHPSIGRYGEGFARAQFMNAADMSFRRWDIAKREIRTDCGDVDFSTDARQRQENLQLRRKGNTLTAVLSVQ